MYSLCIFTSNMLWEMLYVIPKMFKLFPCETSVYVSQRNMDINVSL